MGGSTLALEQLSTISENQILGEAQKALFDLLLPGIICSMGVGGNVHAWHLWIAACINGLIYFGIGWFLYKTAVRLRRVKKPLIVLAVVILSGISARAQISEADGFNDTKRLYASGQCLNAEKGFANIVREHPDDVAAQMYLGHTLFHEEKYADAVVPYEKGLTSFLCSRPAACRA